MNKGSLTYRLHGLSGIAAFILFVLLVQERLIVSTHTATLRKTLETSNSVSGSAKDTLEDQIQPPELRAAIRSVQVTAVGSLNSTPNTTFILEFFFRARPCQDTSPIRPIPLLVGKQTITTDSNGNAAFTFNFTSPVPLAAEGGSIDVAATDPSGNTSELQCIPIEFPGNPNLSALNTSKANATKTPDTNKLTNIQPNANSGSSAIGSSTITGEFFGVPNTPYGLQFFFSSDNNSNSCSREAEQSLNVVPAIIKTDENGMRSFSITLATPLTGGFINCIATDLSGAVSPSSSCVPIIEPSCPPSLSPTVRNIDAVGIADAFEVGALPSCSNLNILSNAEWVKIESIPPAADTILSASIQYTVQPNTTGSLRIGTIGINGRSFTITQEGSVRVSPRISRAERDGKHLIVLGEGFGNKARVLINGQQQKTVFDSSTKLIVKKGGKKIKPGDKIQVRNLDGTLSNEILF